MPLLGTDNITAHSEDLSVLKMLQKMQISMLHIESLIQNIHTGIDVANTSQGLSFLEMKYNVLLSYLADLTYVIMCKSSTKTIDGDPCIDRLLELQLLLEKIRPIENKLKYQVDKLVTMATSNNCLPIIFKANPNNLLEELDESANVEIESAKGTRKIYVPSKLSAQHYPDNEAGHRNLQERNKKLALSSSVLQDLRDEYLDVPLETMQNSRAQDTISKHQHDRREYEEEFLTRLPLTKLEKSAKRNLTTIGTVADEVTNFVNTTSKRKDKHKYLNKRGTRKRNMKNRKNL